MAKTAGSRAELDEQAKRDRALDQLQRADLVAVLGTAEGRRLIWRFLEAAGPFRSAFNTNAMSQAHTIGWQDAGKWWLAEIDRACPEKYSQMAAEARRAAKDAAFRTERNDEETDGPE